MEKEELSKSTIEAFKELEAIKEGKIETITYQTSEELFKDLLDEE